MENTDMVTRTYRVHYPNGKVIDVTLPVELLYQLGTAVIKVSHAMHPDASYTKVGIPTVWTILARLFSLHPDVVVAGASRITGAPLPTVFVEINEAGEPMESAIHLSDGTIHTFPLEYTQGVHY